MTQPEIAILVSSFERPRHVRRVLASIAAQRGVQGAFEVIVTDDGSRDETPRMVRQFAASATFPVRFVTHAHEGFHIARCRNEGVAAATAPYLLFLDGDCIIPPDHLRIHLDRRESGVARAGYPIHINHDNSEQITDDEVSSGRFLSRVSSYKHFKMRCKHVRAVLYSLIRDRKRPKLLGGNLGIARADYERVNGYDEVFRGWGCEDDDLRLRLRAAGIEIASIAWWTNTYHLWHPRTPTAPAKWRAGANVEYLSRTLRLTRCLAGLTKRRLEDLRVRLLGRPPSTESLKHLPSWCRAAINKPHPSHEPAEIEIAFSSDVGVTFSNRADCRILIISPAKPCTRALARRADLIFAEQPPAGFAQDLTFPLPDFDAIMRKQLGVPSPVSRRPGAAPPAPEPVPLPAAA